MNPRSSVRALTLLLVVGYPAALHAAQRENALSNAEIEQLRDTNQLPNERIHLFQKFLDERVDTINTLTTRPRRPGREEDIDEAMQQFESIATDLEDNLDDYDRRHGDMRKELPKLLKALDHWTEIINSPKDNAAYNTDRKLSLETIADLREQTTKLLEDQKLWFKDHPPSKQSPDTPPVR